jgi:ABC-2 type transport system permease protein
MMPSEVRATRFVPPILRARRWRSRSSGQLARDRATLAMIVGIPRCSSSSSATHQPRRPPRSRPPLLDRAASGLSRRLAGELAATQAFDIRRRVDSDVEAFRLLERSEVGAVIVIPSDLDRRLYRGRGMELSILADATIRRVASAVALAGEGYGRSSPPPPALRHRRRARRAAHDAPRSRRRSARRPSSCARAAQVQVLPFYNPERRTAVFIVPGLVGVILTMTMMLMTALALVRERERGTFEFLIATPIRAAR